MNNEPLTMTNTHQYAVVARAVEYIRQRAFTQPSLEEIARFVGLSEHHFQRLFTQWAGVSPKRFLQYVTKEHAKAALQASTDIVDAALQAGLSTPCRLHDLVVTCESMTLGKLKAFGADVTIRYGYVSTLFGDVLLAWTTRGVCHLQFCDDDHPLKLDLLKAQWLNAILERDDSQAERLAQRIFPSTPQPRQLHLVLRGTAFQIKVWEALLRIQPAQIVSYTQLAALVGAHKAQRAVGSALAANTIGYLIPCHRVIRESGDMGNYRWGLNRKSVLLAWEASQRSIDA